MMLATILIPIIGAFIVLVVGRWHELRNVLSVVLASCTALLAILQLPHALSGATHSWHAVLIPGIHFVFTADALAVFMAFSSSLIGAFIVIYSLGYMSDSRHQTEYYFFVLLFIGAMMGLVYSANIILMYVFWEITAICSWRLIGHHRSEVQHLVNADKAFLMTVFGSTCMLLGFEVLHRQTHSFDFAAMHSMVPTFGVALLLVLGIIGKSAQMPLQTWLPDAGVAPTPVTALLHAAVLVKIGAFAFARLFLTVLRLPPAFNEFFIVVILLGVLTTACAALVEYDMKRILAYSTISQIGLILIGFALGNALGIAGALFYIFAHGVSKAGLFLGVGVIDHAMKQRDIRKLRGMARLFPANSVGFFLCALSIMGIPPFGGFFAKVMILVGALQQHKLLLAIGIGVAAILSILYIMRLWTTMFMGTPVRGKTGHTANVMAYVVIIFGILSLLSVGILRYPFNIIGTITNLILR